jgi:hypothetical protein
MAGPVWMAVQKGTAAAAASVRQHDGSILILFIYLITGLLDNIRHCCPVDGPSQTQ